jgi:pimeloyl-ACP methyl ester carboxylesterase
MLQVHRRDLGTVELNYAEGPAAGPPLVILHGGSARWQYGERLLTALARRWHVYAPDLRGHGRSGWVPGRYRLRDYAGDIAAFLREVVREPAALYGHSLGGEVALMAAASAATGVRALIVGDSPLSSASAPSNDPAHRAMVEYWHDLAASTRPPAEIAAALRAMPLHTPGEERPRPAGEVMGAESPWFDFMAVCLHQLDPDTLQAVLADPAITMAGYEMPAILPAIPCPVLLLQADPAAGGLHTDAEVAEALTLLPHGQHRRLAGIGHPLHSTHPDAVCEAIETFLDALPSPKRERLAAEAAKLNPQEEQALAEEGIAADLESWPPR